jgi:hypothetical protein
LAQIPCVYKEVGIVKAAAATSKEPSGQVAIISYDEKPDLQESWLGLFEQFFRFDKWNACRVQAAAICDSRLK